MQQSEQQQHQLSIEDVMQQWLPTVTDITAHSIHVHLPDIIAKALQIASHICSSISDLHEHISTLRSIQPRCAVDDNRTTTLSKHDSSKPRAHRNAVTMMLQVTDTGQSLDLSATAAHSNHSINITCSTSIIVDSLHAGTVYSILPLAISQDCITALNTVFQAIIDYQHSIGQQASQQLQQASDALFAYSSVTNSDNADNTVAAMRQMQYCTDIKTLSTCKY